MQPGLKPNKKGEKRRGGRQKGTANKVTLACREAIEYAFQEIGGAEALATWARNNREAFYTRIYTRLLPSSVTRALAVHGGGMSEEDARARFREILGVVAPELKDDDDELNDPHSGMNGSGR